MVNNCRVLVAKTGKIFFVKDIATNYHTQYGFITKADLKKKSGATIYSNTKDEFTIFEPSFLDYYRKMKRGPQIVPLKDIGIILSNVGIEKTWKVVDAGAGNGGVCLFLANLVKKVTTYEIRGDFANIVKKNIEFLGMKNITLKEKSIYEGIAEKNIDLITLDLPEPWLVIEHAAKALRVGGYLVSYSPSIPQTSDFNEKLKEFKAFQRMKVVEIIEREWDMQGRIQRPKTTPVGHSGFMTFARKIKPHK